MPESERCRAAGQSASHKALSVPVAKSSRSLLLSAVRLTLSVIPQSLDSSCPKVQGPQECHKAAQVAGEGEAGIPHLINLI